MMSLYIILAIVAAVIAWMVIPRKPAGPGSNRPEAMPPVFNWPGSPPNQGPFAASVEEKMAVVESELRSRQADKYRKAVIDEVAELVGSSSKAK